MLFTCGTGPGNEGDVNIAEVLPLHLELELPECLHEGHPLDVPDGAAQLLNKMAPSSQYTNGFCCSTEFHLRTFNK
jgi:hypothetical protein